MVLQHRGLGKLKIRRDDRMKKTDKNKKIWKMATASFFCFLVMASAAQVAVEIHVDALEITKVENERSERPNPSILTLNNDYFTWKDDFNNSQNIDKSRSENYIVEGGEVKMYGTHQMWSDPSWTRMKKITIDSSVEDTDCAIKLIVYYDSDMRSDYGDLRFKFNDDNFWLDYWIEEKNPEPNNPYAIVWVKIPALPSGASYVYLFYGNPIATDQSDYWLVFDENSWEKKYAHDHQVTYHMASEGAWDPDITYGSNKFLVTWEEGTPFTIIPPMIFQQQIRGCFYDEDGNLEGNRFDITEVESPPYRYENPTTAYGNGKFFVAFEHYNNPFTNNNLKRDIEGAIVTTSGSISRFDICTGDDIEADPCVAYDNNHNRFFVVWEDARSSTQNYDLYGKMYDSNGNQIGAEIPVYTEANTQCEPWIAFDSVNNHYLIVWEESSDDPETGPFSIGARVFDYNGNALGSAIEIAHGISSTDYNFPCVAFCPLVERFLVTWQEDDISSDDWHGNIWGKMLDENGQVIVDTFEIAHGEFCRTDVFLHLSTSFFVAYDDKGGDIWGKLVSSEGRVNPYTLQLSDGESEPADWVNLGSSGEKIFVAWEDTRIVYQPLDQLPDVFANVWSFNTPSESDISFDFGDEESLVLEAFITSVEIEPSNWQVWHEFNAEKIGNIVFDILDGETLQVLRSDVALGSNIEGISASSIRFKAHFSRSNPSSTPYLDEWSVSYVGRDDDPPRTTLDNIDGVKGLNDWYVSEGVTIWLRAEDFPKDTGSGIDTIYYILNHESPQVYNVNSGIQLGVSQSSNWMGEWNVRFWSVDKKGNVENKDKPENKLTIKIDADRPYVQIIEPVNEQEVEVPFWVRVDASDNSGIVDKVEFDISPFGEREGLPYKDYTSPFEWYCDVDQIDAVLHSFPNDPNPLGVNVMVRAQVYDKSGQTWIHEVWVHITNWKKNLDFDNRMCLILAPGTGIVTNVQTVKNENIVNTEEITLGCFVFGDINWEYSAGFCLSVGMDGVHSVNGVHSGAANKFLGIANKNIIVGVAAYVLVES